MPPYALTMSEEAYAHIPEWLQAQGIRVEPYRDIGEFRMLRCRRGATKVLLSMTRPAHWAAADDERRGLVVVAVIGVSLFRFWRIPRENRLRREIIELLRPHGWQGG